MKLDSLLAEQVAYYRLGELGWCIEVHQTAGPFYWGSGGRA
jgi:hypothetical protein